MNLPAAVIKQNEEADRLLKEAGAEVVKEVVIEIDPEILKDGRKPDEVPDIDIDNLNNPIIKKDEPAKIIKEAPKDEEKEALSYAQSMYKKFENENHTLRIKNGQHERTILDLRAEIVTLVEYSGINNKKEPELKVEPVSQTFSEKDKEILAGEGHSDEAIEIFERMGVQVAPTPIDNSRIETLENEIKTVKAETVEDKKRRFWEELNDAAPQWDDLNEDPGFTAYLSTYPPYSDKNLGQIMSDAQKMFDVPKIAEIFNDYKVNDGVANLEDPNKNLEKVIPKKETPKLADLAQPKSSNTIPPAEKSEKWNTSQIQKFYADLAKDPKKYTDVQLLAIEKKYIYPN